MVYRFIDENKKYFGLRWLCLKFNISTNCYYNYLKNKKYKYYKKLNDIYERIKYIYYTNNRVIGHRITGVLLRRYGIYLSKTTVHKYMNKVLNLTAIIMRKKTKCTNLYKKHKIFDNLINQNFNVNKKNKIWCTDFTYLRRPNGKFIYNCSIIDLFDRPVVASVNSKYLNTDLAINTLSKGLEQEKYPKDLILHSDQGVQFTSMEFVRYCKENGIRQSMSKGGCPYDNAPMERFYNTFKNCFYNRFIFDSTEVLDEMMKKYINWYNYVRPHSYNNYLTPMEVRFG